MSQLRFEDVVTPTLLKRFSAEAACEDGDPSKFYGIVRRDDGQLFVHHPNGPALDVMQLLWAAAVLRLLNRELHHDGAWVAVFTHPRPTQAETAVHVEQRGAYYCRYALIHLDRDGDPQFSQEWLHGDSDELRDFARVIAAGIESTAQKCEASWQYWNLLMRQVLEPKTSELYKRAKGERAPSLN